MKLLIKNKKCGRKEDTLLGFIRACQAISSAEHKARGYNGRCIPFLILAFKVMVPPFIKASNFREKEEEIKISLGFKVTL